MSAHPRLRSIEIVRGLWGAALLAAPGAVLTRVHGVEPDRTAVTVARILGARHLVQATFSGVNPSPEVLAAGTWVDSVHSVTAFGLAAADSAPGAGRHHRRNRRRVMGSVRPARPHDRDPATAGP